MALKIPGLDELKKMGGDLIDSAKSVKMGEAVDKLKSKIESMANTNKKDSVVVPAQEADSLQAALLNLSASLEEVTVVLTAQAGALKKIQNQLTELTKTIETKK